MNGPPEVWILPEGSTIYRVAIDELGATEFSAPTATTRRFGPWSSASDGEVGTLYSAESIRAALMETVFHDTDLTVAEPPVYLSDLRRTRYSTLSVKRALSLARFDDLGLAAVGLTRGDLIDTPPTRYTETFRSAVAVHQDPRLLDGIMWSSRRDPNSLSFVFFHDRVVRKTDLRVVDPPVSLFEGLGYNEVMRVATEFGITVIQ